MKTNFTLWKHLLKVRIILFLLFPVAVYAQPDYIFKNAVLESGTDLQIGSSYRFTNVKPGIDGIMTIMAMSGGMTLNQLDGPSGFDEAFQPYINCAGKKKGYVEFQLDFVTGGTFSPANMLEVPLTAIDIDGYEFPDDKLFEYDEFLETPGFVTQYDMIGTSLDIKMSSGWVTALNKTAITYDGIDTTQRDVMFSAIHYNVSSVTFRVGADNKSNNFMTRLRSVYFKKFKFASGILPISGLLSFNGLVQNNSVQLNWELASNCGYQKITLEKSSTGKGFLPVSDFTVSPTGPLQKMSFRDPANIQGNVFYRLKSTDLQGKPSYSQIVVIKNNLQSISGFKIYPNVVESGASINLNAEQKQQASLMVTDFAGRVMKQQNFQVQPGSNSLSISGMENWSAGQYVVVLQMGSEKYAQQIMKR